MSSIKEDELNMIIDFANETPSMEQLLEYTDWKLIHRPTLLEVIKGMDYEDRMREVYEYYVTTIEYDVSKHITQAIDQMLINQSTVFLHEFNHVFSLLKESENKAYPLWRESMLHQSNSRKMKEIGEYISMTMASRMPIFEDCRWIVAAPELKETVLKGIPK